MAKKKTTKRSNGQAKSAKNASTQEGIKLPIAREFPSGQIGVMSNDFVIQHDDSEFHLLFFQSHPPMILGETEQERRQAAKALKAVRSVCVARIVVSADRLPSFIKAMQENLEKHGQKHDAARPDAKQTEADK